MTIALVSHLALRCANPSRLPPLFSEWYATPWVGAEGWGARAGTGVATDVGQGTALTMLSLDHLLEVLLGFLFHDGLAGTNICIAKRDGHFGASLVPPAPCELTAPAALPTAQRIVPSWGRAGPFNPGEPRQLLQQPRASPSLLCQPQLLRRLSRRCSCFSPFSSWETKFFICLMSMLRRRCREKSIQGGDPAMEGQHCGHPAHRGHTHVVLCLQVT